MNQPRPPILIQPKTVFAVLCLATAFLGGAHLAALTMKLLGHERVFGLVRLFDMDRERNIPTLFSTCLFLANSFLCLGIARATWLQNKPAKTWCFLSLLLFFFAIDEFCQVHEYVGEAAERLLAVPDSFFVPTWLIPYAVVGILFLAVLLPFWMRQERRIRRLMAASAAIFIGGAAGVELLAGKYVVAAYGERPEEFNMNVDLWYGLLVVVEETFEMLGLAMLGFTLLTLLQRTHGGLILMLPGSAASGGHKFERADE